VALAIGPRNNEGLCQQWGKATVIMDNGSNGGMMVIGRRDDDGLY
jgi:hypothetical protein